MQATNPNETPFVGAACQLTFGTMDLNRPVCDVSEELIQSSSILIFDQIETAKEIREELTRGGFRTVSFTNQYHVANDAIVGEEATDLLLISGERLKSDDGKRLISSCRENHVSSLVLVPADDATQIKRIAVEIGVDDFLTLPSDGFEVVSRTRNTLHSKLAGRKLAEFSAQIQSDILIDSLTQISNRRAFDFELSRKMIEWERQRSPLALLMIDIDYFKRVNDQFGHPAGDMILMQVAAAIKDAVRDMDLVCRYGGEEFAAILPIKRPQESLQSAERIRQKIAATTFEAENLKLNVTVSIGVAEAMKGDDQELIVKRADTALYDSKRNGRNRVTFHDGAQCKEIQDREPDLDNAESESAPSWAVNDDVFNLCSSNILIVDDSWAITQVAKNFLSSAGYRNLICETDSRKVLPDFDRHPPDLVLLDVSMPHVDGLTILKQIRSNPQHENIPVVIFTSHTDCETKSKCLELGASDFLQKPLIASELIARVRNTLLAHAHTKFLANYSRKLEQEVKIRTAELIASRREAIQCLARAAEMKDDHSGLHVIRVGKYAAIVANELGFTDVQVIELEHAAQLHDVGNLGLPDSVLKKQERLTDEEYSIVQDHCNHGGKIIRDDVSDDEGLNVSLLDSCSTPVMRMAALVAETHHEKWDGSGYPHGLKGQNIPIEGRIVAVCDVFDAISNPKAYRDAYDLDRSFEMIRDGAGSHFDPEVVEAFFRSRNAIVQVYRDFGEALLVNS